MTRNPRQIEAKSLTGFSAAAGKQGMIDTLNHGVTGTPRHPLYLTSTTTNCNHPRQTLNDTN